MNAQKLLLTVATGFLKTDIPNFRIGNTVRVHVKVVEGDSERIQPFEGVVTSRRGSGISETFTVRKISFGIGIERTFPVHSPRIAKMEIIKQNKARRAKLFYLRKLSGKAARLTEKDQTLETAHETGTASKVKADSAATEASKKKNPEPALTR